jgi:hypothetical protein
MPNPMIDKDLQNLDVEEGEDPRKASGESSPGGDGSGLRKGEKVAEWSEDQEDEEEDPVAP